MFSKNFLSTEIISSIVFLQPVRFIYCICGCFCFVFRSSFLIIVVSFYSLLLNHHGTLSFLCLSSVILKKKCNLCPEDDVSRLSRAAPPFGLVVGPADTGDNTIVVIRFSRMFQIYGAFQHVLKHCFETFWCPLPSTQRYATVLDRRIQRYCIVLTPIFYTKEESFKAY